MVENNRVSQFRVVVKIAFMLDEGAGAGCSTSGGPRQCWPSYKPHDGTSPHVREHRL